MPNNTGYRNDKNTKRNHTFATFLTKDVEITKKNAFLYCLLMHIITYNGTAISSETLNGPR